MNSIAPDRVNSMLVAPQSIRRSIVLVLPLLFGWLAAAPLRAQVSFTTTPKGDVRQVSLSELYNDEGIVAARLEASRAKQIRVNIQIVSVDDETRQKIYADLGVDAVKTLGGKITQADEQASSPSPMHDSPSYLQSSNVIETTSHVSTSVMSQATAEEFLNAIVQSPASKVMKSPSMLLLDGQRAGYSDISQRPFVISVDKTEGGLSPDVQVIDEGMRLFMTASLSEWTGDAPARIKLQNELRWHKILDVKTEQVFGLDEGATPVQVPTYLLKTAIAAEELTQGQSLMVDPYLEHTVTIEKETGHPMLKKVPYLSRNFKNVSRATSKQHIMLLLQPKLH